jgi:hypothetical protein
MYICGCYIENRDFDQYVHVIKRHPCFFCLSVELDTENILYSSLEMFNYNVNRVECKGF